MKILWGNSRKIFKNWGKNENTRKLDLCKGMVCDLKNGQKSRLESRQKNYPENENTTQKIVSAVKENYSTLRRADKGGHLEIETDI